MSDPFVAEIRIFAFNFAPTGWAFCNGQLLPISQNTALFSLLGTSYGGDGKSTFALPDLQGSAPMQPGQGQGLSLRILGEVGGVETVTLLQSEMPVHTHTLAASASSDRGELQGAVAGTLDRALGRPASATSSGTPNVTMAPQALAGRRRQPAAQQHAAVPDANFCIALQGVFPPRLSVDASRCGRWPTTDRAFLLELYASTRERRARARAVGRATEGARSSSSSSRRRTRTTARNYPGATLDVIEVDGEPAGRLVRARGARGHPDHGHRAGAARSAGAGSGPALLRVAARGGRGERPHGLDPRRGGNPARRLYERLGFREAEERGVYVLMIAS